MTYYECAARISEHDTIDGTPGDQTKGEVCVSPYRNLRPEGYQCVMRYFGAKQVNVRNRIVRAAYRLAINDNVGYAQPTRNTLYKLMQKYNWRLAKVPKVGLCNTDCSAFVGVCVNVAMVPIKLVSAIPSDIWTGNMRNYLEMRGFREVQADVKTGKGLLAGDILINYAHHTTIFMGNVPTGQIAKASSAANEATPSPKKSFSDNVLDSVALNVIEGLYGNGAERVKKLREDGYDPMQVQARVNELFRSGKY